MDLVPKIILAMEVLEVVNLVKVQRIHLHASTTNHLEKPTERNCFYNVNMNIAKKMFRKITSSSTKFVNNKNVLIKKSFNGL